MPRRRLNLAGALERVKTAVTATRQWERGARENALARVERALRHNHRHGADRLKRGESDPRQWVRSPQGHWRGPPDTAAVPETEEFWHRYLRGSVPRVDLSHSLLWSAPLPGSPCSPTPCCGRSMPDSSITSPRAPAAILQAKRRSACTPSSLPWRRSCLPSSAPVRSTLTCSGEKCASGQAIKCTRTRSSTSARTASARPSPRVTWSAATTGGPP